jgi:hypothetical protein
MALFDDIGNVITDTNISSPPVVNVLFSGQVLGEVPPDSDNILPSGNANKHGMSQSLRELRAVLCKQQDVLNTLDESF